MSAERPQLAILASGSATTAQALIEGIDRGELKADVAMFVTNNPGKPGLGRIARINTERAQIADPIATYVVNREVAGGEAPNGVQTIEEARMIMELLKIHDIDLVLCLGWMKKVVEIFKKYPTLNTHPGLLPFSAGLIGANVQQYALDKKQTHSGQTLHWVTEEYDEGETVAEHKVLILPDDDKDSLFDRVQIEEKKHIASDVQIVLDELFKR